MVAPYRPSAGVNVPQMLLTSSGYGAAPASLPVCTVRHHRRPLRGRKAMTSPSFTEGRMSIWRVFPSSSVHLPTLGMVRPASGFTGYRYAAPLKRYVIHAPSSHSIES